MNITKNKKGISAVVATVLIILITVAAVTIIWAAVIPLVNKQIDKGTVCLDATSQISLGERSCLRTNNTHYNLSIQVKRGPKEFELSDILVLVELGGGNSESFSAESLPTSSSDKFPPLPRPSEERVYEIKNVETAVTGIPRALQIAAVVNSEGDEVTCDATRPLVLTSC